MILRSFIALVVAVVLSSCAPASTEVSSSPSTASPTPRQLTVPTVSASPTQSPAPAPPEAETAPAEPAPIAPPAQDQLEDRTPQLLTLYVSGYGDQSDIDACIGWIIFTPYEGHNIQPTIAEHNNCGGAAILELPIGARLQVMGSGLDGVYEIVDSRDAPQSGTTLDIQGINGDILAQSCYFNSQYMRFIGLTKVQ